MWDILFLNQPDLINKLVVEDVSPTTKRSVVKTAFPHYIESMKAIKFDDSLPFPAVRKQADKELEEVFYVRQYFISNILNTGDGWF